MERISERLYEQAFLLEEKSDNGIKHPYLKTLGIGTTLGAGIGGAKALKNKTSLIKGMLKGSAKGTAVGAVASLLLMGGAGIAQFVSRAREKTPESVKQSIRNAVSHAEKSSKLTNTQKAAIRNNAKAAIDKIDKTYNR